MAIGSFMGRTFTVSDRRIFTPSNLKAVSYTHLTLPTILLV